jgi:predicted HAD superfamily phosphohydrolase YqeG
MVDLSIEFENSSKVQSLRSFNIHRIFKAKLPTPVLLAVKRSLEFLQRDLERCVHDGDELLRKMAENSTF